ncbi:MAG TPA: response regulator transcription factor [Terriglobales bacterium]
MSEIGKIEGSENRRRILLADDHPLLLERVAKFLQSTFDVVGVAHNGLEMVEKAKRLNPDIIVADISMPELDGIEAARRLREVEARATIVFLTIHQSPEFVEAWWPTYPCRSSTELKPPADFGKWKLGPP